MIKLEIPGYGDVKIENILLDYNGTIASEGKLIPDLKSIMEKLSKKVKIFVLTADTFGTVEEEIKDLPIEIIKIKKENERQQKEEALKKLGPKNTISYGNGNNDKLMIKESIIGICIMGDEGCSRETLEEADLVINSIEKGLLLLLDKNKLKATLRY
ncbi:MAG: haloacid dehalogenase [Eubacteriales bacterium]